MSAIGTQELIAAFEHGGCADQLLLAWITTRATENDEHAAAWLAERGK